MEARKAAYSLGYFTGSGVGDQLYAQPKDTITREAAMTILARVLQISSDSDALSQFPDGERTAPWARPGLTAMVERGIIEGSDGKLLPQAPVTRGQMAKLLWAMG